MTSCPECASSDVSGLGFEHGERHDDGHVVLASRFRCNVYRCKFTEIQVTTWKVVVTQHGGYERLLMMETGL